MVLQGSACYEGVSLLLLGGLRAVAATWRLDTERVADAEARLSLVVGPPAIVGGSEVPAWGREPVNGGPTALPVGCPAVRGGAARRVGLVSGAEALRWPQGGLAVRRWPQFRP